MQHNTYIYIFIMVFVCFLIRALPMLLIQKPIENRFIRSFLYYVPYVTLAVMTFPAIVQATATPISGAAALVVGSVVALLGGGLITVAGACCIVVFLLELILVK